MQRHDINTPDITGESPLFKAARFSKRELKFLDGVYVNALGGVKPCKYEYGSEESAYRNMQVMIDGSSQVRAGSGDYIPEKGLNIGALDLRDNSNRLPLHYIFMWRFTPYPDVLRYRLEFLLKRGADKNLLNKAGQRPIDVFKESLATLSEEKQKDYADIARLLE